MLQKASVEGALIYDHWLILFVGEKTIGVFFRVSQAAHKYQFLSNNFLRKKRNFQSIHGSRPSNISSFMRSAGLGRSQFVPFGISIKPLFYDS